jgi:hypothetical protein
MTTSHFEQSYDSVAQPFIEYTHTFNKRRLEEMVSIELLLALVLACGSVADALDNGLAVTPPMGFRT